jgi:hypothetical protein
MSGVEKSRSVLRLDKREYGCIGKQIGVYRYVAEKESGTGCPYGP